MMRELFDFMSPRTKEGLGELKDIFLWMQYLYLNRENSIRVWGTNNQNGQQF